MSDFQRIKIDAKKMLDSGEWHSAIEKFHQANILNEDDVDILIGLGISYINLEDIEKAKHWFEKAEQKSEQTGAEFPAIAYMYLGNIYRSQHNIDKAIEYYQLAIASYPDFPAAHILIAGLFMGKKELDDAEYHYKYAIKLQPENADAYANLAQVYELLNRADDAREAIKNALKYANNHAGALFALAKIEKREKNYQQAEDVLTSIINSTNQPAIKAMAYMELGHVLDKQKRFDDAYQASTTGKQIWSKEVANIPFDKSEYQNKIIRNKKYFTRAAAGSDSYSASSGYHSPIFFIGFPRSGTTLAEQILNQHPKIVTSDEKTFIDKVIDNIPTVTRCNTSYPECLDEINDADYQRLRQVYWDTVSNELPEFNTDSILVDKLPLNIIELGFINRLFPDAHILVALRDPRDACLSGFMQSFTPNPAMINFLSMQTSVEFYWQVMSLWLHYREVLNMKWHQYRYEDLVADFNKTTREIFAFLELEYPDNASDFHLAAGKRSISTPSYQDVATPIYQRSKARWRNYQHHFDPYMEVLQPFLDEFGYADDND